MTTTMSDETRTELSRLLFGQCQSIMQDIAIRAISQRSLTDAAITDIKRCLEHMIRAIDERAA